MSLGVLPIARGPEVALREFIAGHARHGYSTEVVNGRRTKIPGTETLLVPGIPETDDEADKLKALQNFITWIAPSAIKSGLTIVITPTADEVKKLPKTYRPVMTERLDNLYYKDIAAKLDVPIGTVRSRINRSRAYIMAKRAADLANAAKEQRSKTFNLICHGIELAKGGA
jgi:DNA-directed RNA polymerase specialized sigma24 family protein